MSSGGSTAEPAAGTPSAAAKQFVNLVRAETPASFYLTQLPAQLIPGVALGISTEPLPARFVDLYVLPVRQYTDGCLEAQVGEPPVIAYGAAELLPLAFDCGCRDYLREPWNISELRVRAGRHLPPRRMRFSWAVVEMHRNSLRCLQHYSSDRPGGRAGPEPLAVKLSPPEAALLKQLLAFGENPVPRECLQYALRHTARISLTSQTSRTSRQEDSRAVDVHISGLRKKFNRLAGYQLIPSPIRSIYGYGYQLIHS
ncbi:MAG: hypothetical protein ACOCZA_06040 [Spirochaetota bacterium]